MTGARPAPASARRREKANSMTTESTLAAPAPAASARLTQPTGGSRLERRRQRWGWLFVSPFLAVFALFLVFPLFYAFGMSLFTSTLATGTTFTGADNYLKAFTDPLFLEGLVRVAAFALVMIPAQLIVALAAALVLDTLATRL